jgi:hypothetical protein
MGLRRLRGRLDQLQGEANATMGMAQALLAELQDGFGVEIEVAPHAGKQLLELLKGKGGTLPVRIRVLPDED